MENNEINMENEHSIKESNFEKNKKKKNKKVIIIVLLIVLIISIGGYFLIIKSQDSEKTSGETKKLQSPYMISDNTLQTFDLQFLKLENEQKNKVYSPLSIKYALAMLKEGTKNNSKDQIEKVLGNYEMKKYTNSKNMSLANALFVKDTYKENINHTYVDTIKEKYNAEVIYDSFKTPKYVNNWVSDKTFKLIENLFDNVSEEDFILINSLAIDMEWVKKLQDEHKYYYTDYAHEDYSFTIQSLDSIGYSELKFDNKTKSVKSTLVGAVANNYDIINEIGEEKIRETVGNEYKKWLADPERNTCGEEYEVDVETYLDNYIQEINDNYTQVSSSTDFNFYVDEDVKVFAKNLKEYDDTTLQYIGIMPKKDTLDNYVKNMNTENINEVISKLKPIELASFNSGVITELSGYIPMFKFEYDLSLIEDLKQMGITDVFDSKKVDLSNLTSQTGASINEVKHKSNIEFSNEGIKASATTALGGRGGGVCGFDYLYEVPVEKIDLTFDNPYLFLIRDKSSGEVWFMGTVYEPVKYEKPDYSGMMY